MKFYMLREDLGEPNYNGDLELFHTEEEPLAGYYDFATLYVYKHRPTGALCGVKFMWSEESGSDNESVLMGRFFEDYYNEIVELVEIEKKEVITYEWKEK